VCTKNYQNRLICVKVIVYNISVVFFRHSVLHGCIHELNRISNCAVSVDLESLNDLQDRCNCEVFLMRFIDDLCNIRQDAVAELLKSLRTCASDAVSGKLIAKVKRNDKYNTAKK